MIRLSHDLLLYQDQIHMANTNLGRFTLDSQAFLVGRTFVVDQNHWKRFVIIVDIRWSRYTDIERADCIKVPNVNTQTNRPRERERDKHTRSSLRLNNRKRRRLIWKSNLIIVSICIYFVQCLQKVSEEENVRWAKWNLFNLKRFVLFRWLKIEGRW